MDGARSSDLIELLEQRASDFADRPLFTFLNRSNTILNTLSYSSLFRSAKAIATEIQSRKLEKSPIGLLFPHGPEFITAFFGVLLAGAFPMPLVRSRGRDWNAIERTINQSSSTCLLTLSSKGEHVPGNIASACQMIYLDEIDLSGENLWRRPHVRGDDLALIQFTSGSTSAPKGVAITHANVLHNSESIRRDFRNTRDDVGVTWLPFHHDMGLIGHVLQPLYTGIHNYFLSPITFVAQPFRWLEAISKFGGTISGGPTFAFDICIKKLSPEQVATLDLQHWRLAYCGSERINPETLNLFVERFENSGFKRSALHPCYGMAESTLFISGTDGISSSKADGSSAQHVAIGDRHESADIRIVDPESLREIDEDGAIGEIWVKSKSIAREYFKDSCASQVTFSNALNGTDGYLRTGDLGFFAFDKLFFVGRIKNLFKVRGTNYCAEDIEEHIQATFGRTRVVRNVAFSIPHPDEDKIVIALELTTDELLANPQETIDLVTADVCQSIGILPMKVFAVGRNQIPLTTSGKPQRMECRELYRKVNEQSLLY